MSVRAPRDRAHPSAQSPAALARGTEPELGVLNDVARDDVGAARARMAYARSLVFVVLRAGEGANFPAWPHTGGAVLA